MTHPVQAPAAPDPVPGASSAGGVMASGRALSSLDLLAVAVAAVLPIAYAPQLGGPTTTPRLAVVLFALPIGVIVLIRLIRAVDMAAIAAATLLGVTLFSALINVAPLQSIKGSILARLTWVLLLGAIGLWAIGRRLTARGKDLLGIALIASTSVNILIGVVQIVLVVETGPLATGPGRASGLLANAAFYGCAVVGPAAYAAVRSVQTGATPWLVASVWMSFGTGISGSRGVVMALVILAAGLLARRAWRAAVAIVLGLGLAFVLTTVVSGSSAVTRTASESSSGRFEVWTYGLRAFLDRPLFGWGFGNHGYAVRPYFTEAFTRASAWDDQFMSWQDPHNIVMMMLVSTGIVGLACAVWFVLLHVRRDADPAFFLAFVLSLIGWMLQPATVHSLPIAFLMLGAAINAPDPAVAIGRAATRVAIAAGMALALLIVLPNALTIRALDADRPETAESLLVWLPGDTVFANEVAWEYASKAVEDADYRELAVEKSSLPLDIDPHRPLYWAQHARRLIDLGEFDSVLPALEQAFLLERWNPSAWEAKLGYALAIQDYALADETREVVCRLDLAMCATGSRFPLQLELDSG